MRRLDLRPWASLLLADLALLWLLQGPLGALLPRGLPGLWVEGALRLGGLWGLLRLGGLLGCVEALLPLLCLVNPLFLSLRALVLGALSAPLVRVAAATWAWLLLGYGAVGLSRALWASWYRGLFAPTVLADNVPASVTFSDFQRAEQLLIKEKAAMK